MISSCRTNQIVNTDKQLEISQLSFDDAKELVTITPNRVKILSAALQQQPHSSNQLSKRKLENFKTAKTPNINYKARKNPGKKLNKKLSLQSKSQTKKVNDFAIIAFLLSLVSLFILYTLFFLPGYSFFVLIMCITGFALAITVSIISIFQIVRSDKQETGKAFAIIAMSLSAIALTFILYTIFSFVLY